MTRSVVVASYSFWHEAQIAKSSLEAAGISVLLADEHTVNMQWLYSNAIGGVKLLVPPESVEQARSILETDFSADVEEETAEAAADVAMIAGGNSINFMIGESGNSVYFCSRFQKTYLI